VLNALSEISFRKEAPDDVLASEKAPDRIQKIHAKAVYLAESNLIHHIRFCNYFLKEQDQEREKL
jgi:hypothetical protein